MVGKKALWIGFAALAFAAGCGNPTVTTLGGSPSGDDTSSSTPPPSTPPPGPAAAIAISPAAFSIDLRESQDLNFTVTSFNHFTGDVMVTVANLPAGLSAASPTASVTLTDNGTATGKITLTSDSKTVAPGAYNAATLTAEAVSDPTITDMKNPAITVNPTITLQTETAKGAGSCTFWDTQADYKDNGAGTCTGTGTVLHLGNATAITVKWVKNYTGAEKHRIHGPGLSGSKLAKIANATACELDGSLTHSGQCGTAYTGEPNVGGNTDETDVGNGSVFQRTLHPASLTATTVVEYYDHTTGQANNPPKLSDLGDVFTIMP